MKKALWVVCLLWLAPVAQAGGLGEFLDLSPEQEGALRVLRVQTEEAVAPLKQQVRLREEVLAEELREEEPNLPGVGRIVVEIHRLREQAAAVRGQARQTAVGLLSDEQQEWLDPLRLSATLAPVARQAVHLNLIGPGEPPHTTSD